MCLPLSEVGLTQTVFPNIFLIIYPLWGPYPILQNVAVLIVKGQLDWCSLKCYLHVAKATWLVVNV